VKSSGVKRAGSFFQTNFIEVHGNLLHSYREIQTPSLTVTKGADIMLTADSFFDLSSWEHPQIFTSSQYVWDGLKNLKSYMDAVSYPLSADNVKKNEPLPQTLVYHHNVFLKADDLRIELGAATKGQVKVFQNDALLEGASVIMAGAVLIGDKIKLGKGCE